MNSSKIDLKFNWQGLAEPSVVTVGNFDGIHAGHSFLLRLMKGVASKGQRLLAVTFEPHPLAVLDPSRTPKRLVDLRTKVGLLQKEGIDQVNVMHFTRRLASMEAEQFITLLREKLAMETLVVGSDFRFGKARRGDTDMLRDLAKTLKFELHVVDDCVAEQGQRVSSKLLRQTIIAGDFSLAAELLGRPYEFGGKVIHGNKMGHELGCPTANLSFRGIPPLHGVYAAWAQISTGQRLPAALAVGYRPAVGTTKLAIEVHLIGYEGLLYGSYLSVQPVQKIRDEQDFPNLDSLRDAIGKDISNCKQILDSAK